LRLSPRERLGAHLSVIGTAHLLDRQFDAAITKLQLAIHERPRNPPAYRSLASCYALMGRLDDARDAVDGFLVHPRAREAGFLGTQGSMPVLAPPQTSCRHDISCLI
jgi:hypothetical protein